VYFVSDRASGVAEIWAARADGSLDPVQITTGSSVLGRPAPSPDGLLVAYARRKPDGTSQLVEHVVVTGAERVLSDALDGEPAYDTTVARIAASTYRWSPSAPDVVVLDGRTGALLQRVTDGVGASGSPAFPR
jgi:hypothetical protein